jgi:fatty-acyl-CoA synthase
VVVLKEAQRGTVSEQEIIDWAHANMAAYKSPRIVSSSHPAQVRTGKVMWRSLQEKESARG